MGLPLVCSSGESCRSYKGGVKRIDQARVWAAKSNGSGPSAIAHEMDISRRQVYRILGEKTRNA